MKRKTRRFILQQIECLSVRLNIPGFSEVVLFDGRRVKNVPEMGERGSSKHPIVLDEEKDKKNSLAKAPMSDGPTEAPRKLRSRPFGRLIEYVYTTLLDQICSVRLCNFISNQLISFIDITVFSELKRYV